MNLEEAREEVKSYFDNFLRKKSEIVMSDVRQKVDDLENQHVDHPVEYTNKRFGHAEGGLHLSDIALYCLLCEKSGIPEKDYHFGISGDDYHYSFYYTDEVLPIFKKALWYNVAQLAFYRCSGYLADYFKIKSDVSASELNAIEKDAIKKEIDGLNIPDKLKQIDI